MRIIVAYDVSTTSSEGRRRLRRIAKLCQSFGTRVQFSVFECSLGDTQWVRLRASILDVVDAEEDSVRFYFIGEDDARKTEHHGRREPLNLDGPLIV